MFIAAKLLSLTWTLRHSSTATVTQRTLTVLPTVLFFISNFRRVINVVCFLLGNSPSSEFYIPTFRNTLFHLHRQVGAESTPTCL